MSSRECHKRSVLKCVSWRSLAFIDTALLSLLFTGSIGSALAIGGIEVGTKSIFYYLHERLWLFINHAVNRLRVRSTADFSETRLYSICKTISWRFIGSIDTFIIALTITGDLATSSSIGIAEVFTKTFLYYVHERIWVRFAWGKVEVAQPAAVSNVPVSSPALTVPAAQV